MNMIEQFRENKEPRFEKGVPVEIADKAMPQETRARINLFGSQKPQEILHVGFEPSDKYCSEVMRKKAAGKQEEVAWIGPRNMPEADKEDFTLELFTEGDRRYVQVSEVPTQYLRPAQ